MKCPKCDYLGFDTGERCRNCGYDFSLIAAPVAAAGITTEPDLPLRHGGGGSIEPAVWPEDLDRALGGATDPSGREATRPGAVPFTRARRADSDVAASRPARASDSALPLFSPASFDDDEPLIKMPAAPRPPLSVRRTPESAATARRAPKEATTHQRNVSRRPATDEADEPTLGFGDDLAYFPSEQTVDQPRAVRTTTVTPLAASSVLRRVVAVLIDHAILLGIDVAVIYFTLRLVSLTWSDWQLLSPLPLAAFLVLIKLAYFSAFTALGGQTIGKMATHIRVVSEQGRFVDPRHALGRALAGALSLLTLGVGFLPALLTSERRALHDRLAHTRVVSA